MKNLEDAQREMRERNARKRREQELAEPEMCAPDDSPEVQRLKNRISELIMENNQLREQKTIVVESPRGRENYSDSVAAQQHNFFKYSNARRRY